MEGNNVLQMGAANVSYNFNHEQTYHLHPQSKWYKYKQISKICLLGWCSSATSRYRSL